MAMYAMAPLPLTFSHCYGIMFSAPIGPCDVLWSGTHRPHRVPSGFLALSYSKRLFLAGIKDVQVLV